MASDARITMRFMPSHDKKWYKRYFTTVRDANYDLNAPLRNGNGQTLLEVAVAECIPAIVAALIELGVRIPAGTSVIRSTDAECLEVQNILIAAGETGAVDSEDDADSMEVIDNRQAASGGSRNPVQIDNTVDTEIIDNDITANYGNDAENLELRDILRATLDDADDSEFMNIGTDGINGSSSAAPAIAYALPQNLYRINVPYRANVLEQDIGVAYNPI